MRARFALALVSLVGLAPAPAPTFAGKTDGKLDIEWVDVEGGGATLIVTPAGESVLIDAGNPGPRDSGRIIKAAKAHGLTQIDHLIITHFHGDHFGGAAEVAAELPIVNLYDNGNGETRKQEAGKAIEQYSALKAGKRHTLKPGDEIPLLRVVANSTKKQPPLSLVCLGVNQQFIAPNAAGAPVAPADNKNVAATGPYASGGPGGKQFTPNEHELAKNPVRRTEDKSDNANSAVLLLRFGSFDFLDCGDLTWNVEEKLVAPINLVGEVDVYQVNHHGLDASNNPLLIQSVAPTVAVFNNGHVKGCQPLAFLAVKNAPSVKAIYQVHKNLRKDVQNNTADDMIANHVATEKCEGHSVRLSVDAEGKAYVVSVPSMKHEKKFESK